MKKFLSIMLAAAMALSLTACNNSSASSESSGSSAADSGAAASTSESQATAESGDGQLLSNPIALNSEGDIDMDTALAYETDYEAMKAYFESREVDPTKPVSENATAEEVAADVAREKEAKKKQRTIEIKEVRLSPNIEENDLNTKVGAAKKFIQKGDKVKVTLRFRGREMTHINYSKQILDSFFEKVEDIAVVDKPPKMEGRSMVMFLSKKR